MKLTKKQQLAVDIAKDVIKWIRVRKLKIKDHGSYLSGDLKGCADVVYQDQVQPHLPALRKHCDVCAKGAMLLSYIELKNKVTFGQVIRLGPWTPYAQSRRASCHGSSCIAEALDGAFDRDQLDRIEDAFECWDGNEWGKKFKTPGKRMIAICQNIIENNGEFKP